MKTMRLTVVLTVLAALMSIGGIATANHDTDVSITSPAANHLFPSGTTTVNFAGQVTKAVDEPGGLYLVVTWAGGSQTSGQLAIPVPGGSGTQTWTYNNFAVQDGETYTVTVYARHSCTDDPPGPNCTTSQASLTFQVANPALTSPTTKEDCDNDGWEDYGFKNHGQCVRFVVNGKDSR
jgi:hypothetical protein